jgi:hypothetical protein
LIVERGDRENYLVHLAVNRGELQPTIAFRPADDRIEWLGVHAEIGVRDLPRYTGDTEEVRLAEDILVGALKDGPRPLKEVKHEIKEADIPHKAYAAGRKNLGIETKLVGVGQWGSFKLFLPGNWEQRYWRGLEKESVGPSANSSELEAPGTAQHDPQERAGVVALAPTQDCVTSTGGQHSQLAVHANRDLRSDPDSAAQPPRGETPNVAKVRSDDRPIVDQDDASGLDEVDDGGVTESVMAMPKSVLPSNPKSMTGLQVLKMLISVADFSTATDAILVFDDYANRRLEKDPSLDPIRIRRAIIARVLPKAPQQTIDLLNAAQDALAARGKALGRVRFAALRTKQRRTRS